MVTKSRLKMALAAEKGIDFKKLKNKKKQKEALKRKKKKAIEEQKRAEEEEDDQWEDEDERNGEDAEGRKSGEEDSQEDDDSEDGEEAGARLDIQALNESDSSDSEVELEPKIERPAKPKPILKQATATKARAASQDDGHASSENDDNEEQEDDIPFSDVDSISSDIVPRTRLTINNRAALLTSLARIQMPSTPFSLTQAHTASSAPPTESHIPDVSDDLTRELAFYAQARASALYGRAELRREGIPFSRPGDYFAEMLKADGHMERVRNRLIEIEGNKKAAAEARKLRDAKKFGKQVQREKLEERARKKRMEEEKIRSLKRKRQDMSTDVGDREADLFDVGVDKELESYHQRSKKLQNGTAAAGKDSQRHVSGRLTKRQKKDEKYGFGGRKRNAKAPDAFSSGDLSGFSVNRNRSRTFSGGVGRKSKSKIKTPRLGKSRRQAAAVKR